MKRFLLLAMALLLCVPAAEAQEIGVIHEFTNRRPPFNKLKSVATGDVNGDGIDEIAVMQGCTLNVFDVSTGEILWQYSFDEEYTADGNDLLCIDEDLPEGTEVNLFGFVEFSGETHAIVAIEKLERGIIAVLIALTSGEVVYQAEERIVAVLELPGGRPAIITLQFFGTDTFTYTFKIIGEIPGSASSNTSGDTAIRSPSYPSRGTYQLDLKFQAEPGQRLAYDPDLFDPPGDTDLDGDGHLDLPMLMVDDGQVAGMAVRGGGGLGILWHFAFPDEHRANILKGFHGFADIDGNGEKEALFGDNLAVTLDGTVHTIVDGFVTLDVSDVDGDGYEDIIGLHTADSTVVVYGALPAGTSAETIDPAQIYVSLFQNYPNPFREATTIAYEVQQPGPVSVTVYDVLGRRVRTLLDAVQPAGAHQVTWDGRDGSGQPIAAGTYFYQLRVGEAVSSKQALHIK